MRTDPTSAPGAEEGRWWSTRRFALLLVLASAVPLLWPVIPPLIDLPGHMASYHVSVDLARSPMLQRYFDFRWRLIGNLGVDLLVAPLAPLLGIEGATKLVVVLIPVATAAGFVLAARVAHGRVPPTAAFALPLAYNYAFIFGFVNYSLAAALAALAFPWWMACTDRGLWLRRSVGFALIAPVVWLAHAIGWVVLGLLCGAFSLQDELAKGRPLVRCLGAAALACLPLATPLILIHFSWRPTKGYMTAFFQWSELAKWIAMLFRDRWIAWDLLSLLVAAGVGVMALTRTAGLRLEPRLAWPAAALVAVYIAAPQNISDSGFVGARIAPYAAAYLLLAVNVRAAHAAARAWAVGAAGFFALRTLGVTASFLLYDASWKAELAALDHVPAGAAVASFSSVRCTNGFSHWFNPRLYHLSGMAVVRRDAFNNGTWGIPGLQLLGVRYAAAGPFRADPSQMVFLDSCAGPGGGAAPGLVYGDALRTLPYDAFDYLWLVRVPQDRWPADKRLTPVWRGGESVLYRIAHRPGA